MGINGQAKRDIIRNTRENRKDVISNLMPRVSLKLFVKKIIKKQKKQLRSQKGPQSCKSLSRKKTLKMWKWK